MTRILPPDEWPRLLAFSPFKEHGLPQQPASWRILVHEVEGEIVGFLCLFDCVHTDGWYLDPAYRQHPGVLRSLITGMLTTLREAGVEGAFCMVPDELASQQGIVERFGFVPAAGKLYLLAVPPAQEG